jgi:nucleotide-binding universal stress UspA family protein
MAVAMAAYLARHDVQVEAKEMSSDGKSVTEVLIAQAGELGADLLVIGAYGHARVFEFRLGGTTQDLLERTSIPVLLSR